MYSDDFDLNALLPDEQEQTIVSKFTKKKEDEKPSCYDDEIKPWLWNGEVIEKIPEEHKSFVYLFTNKITGKQYIGFKTAVSNKTVVVNGKKRKTVTESDWKTYYSSGQQVLHDIAKYGRGNFIREIMALTVNKSVGKYVEAEYQFERGAIIDKTGRYYNGIINLRLNHKLVMDYDKVVRASKLIGDELHEAITNGDTK
jgi:hypothetical protein